MSGSARRARRAAPPAPAASPSVAGWPPGPPGSGWVAGPTSKPVSSRGTGDARGARKGGAGAPAKGPLPSDTRGPADPTSSPPAPVTAARRGGEPGPPSPSIAAPRGPAPTRADARACALALEGLFLPGGQVYALDIQDLPAVLRAALELGFRQVWVGPTAARALGLPAEFSVPASSSEPYRYGIPHPWLNRAIGAGWAPSTEPVGLAPWLGLSHAAGWVDLVIPGWDERNPFAGAPSAAVLLRALQLYSTGLGVRYRRSPGLTGLALMHQVHGRAGVAIPEAHLAPPALEGLDSEEVGAWLSPRPLPRSGWVHGWDLNGMFLAGCSDAWLGFGVPRHDLAPRNVLTSEPGHYRARIIAGAPDLEAWPLPFRADGRPRWYTPPSLRLAVDLGLAISLEEAWVYPERHRWLEPWYAVLRDARRDFLALIGPPGSPPVPSVELALAALKATYAQALGRLAGRLHAEGSTSFRPDWRQTVIARARANMHRHLAGVYRRSGQAPLAINADAVLYLSPHEQPAAATQALGLEVGTQLGKWKHTGQLSASQAAALLRPGKGRPSTPGRRLRALLAALGAAA